jgi:deoxycytidylate deaminase
MIPTNLPNWLQLAQTAALHSNFNIKVGSVIVQRGTPIAIGFNKIKSHPRWCNVGKFSQTIHAEISALMTVAKRDLSGSTIFVYRAHKNGTPALARPCANCQAILKEYGIKRMVYSINEYPYFGVEKL